MNAKYYRFLYHNVTKGICFSASAGAENGRDGSQLLYLSAGAQSKETEFSEADIRCPESAAAQHLDVLILADGCQLTLKRARYVLQTCKTDKIIAPKLPADKRLLPEDCGAGKLCEVTDTYQQTFGNLVLRILCAGDGAGRSLVVYLGSKSSPRDEECVMNIKTAASCLPCALAVDAGNLKCEMRCLLHQDVMQCKKQNREDETYFVDGHLLPGTADMSKSLPEVREFLKEEWRTIRFITLPEDIGPDDALLDAGTPGHQHYFIGTGNIKADVLKNVVTQKPFCNFAAVSAEAGLCISGCYLPK